MQRAEAGGRERGGRHRSPPDPEFRAHRTGPREPRQRRRGSGGPRSPTGQHLLGFPVAASWTPAATETRRLPRPRRVGAPQPHAPAAPGHGGSPASRARRLRSAGPCTPRAGRRDGQPEPPDPKATDPRSGARRPPPRPPPRRTTPEHSHTRPPSPSRASPETPEPAGAKPEPRRIEGLTFNRLDVAMFLQLRLSRDGARFRGAPGQATGGGPASQQGRAARRPAPGVCWAPRRRAQGADLVPSTWSFRALPPYMVTGASPHRRAHAHARGVGSGGRGGGSGSRPELEEEAWTPRASPLFRISLCGCTRGGHRQRI